MLDPGEKRAHSPEIGHAGVLVADIGREEFQEPARGMVAGGRKHGRHRKRAARARRLGRRRGYDHRRHVPPRGAHDDTL
jgi:hypothetical protein